MSYYNYKLDEVLDMDMQTFNTLSQAANIMEARNYLSMIEIYSYPNLKKDAQEKLFRKYNKIAYPKNFEVKNVVKLSDLSKVLK